MASFNKTIITNNGRSLIAKVLSGDQIKFTKMVSSSRDYTSADLSQLTDLSNVEQTILISSIKKTSDSAVKITGIFSNKDLTTGYKFKTVGLYAIDPDLGEILYSVTTASSVDDMPANTGIGLSSITIGLVTEVSNSNNASLEVSDLATVSVLDFNEFKDNVHSQLNDITNEINNTNTVLETVKIDLNTNYAKKTDINELTTNKADKATVEEIKSRVDSTVNGSPRGVFTSLEELNNAYPTGNTNTYIVNNDWHYWNGTTWVSGGEYQNSVLASNVTGANELNGGLFIKRNFQVKGVNNKSESHFVLVYPIKNGLKIGDTITLKYNVQNKISQQAKVVTKIGYCTSDDSSISSFNGISGYLNTSYVPQDTMKELSCNYSIPSDTQFLKIYITFADMNSLSLDCLIKNIAIYNSNGENLLLLPLNTGLINITDGTITATDIGSKNRIATVDDVTRIDEDIQSQKLYFDNKFLSKWSGKKANFIGDSQTAGANTTMIYHQYLKIMLGLAIVRNYGINGSTIGYGSDSMCTRSLNMDDDADLIMVLGGTNDFNLARPLGTFYTETSGVREFRYDTGYFRSSLNILCKNLKTKYPDKTIVICTPLHRGAYQSQPTELQANSNNIYFDEYVESVKEACKIWSIPCLDLYELSGLQPNFPANASLYFHDGSDGNAVDLLHPNAVGHERMANVMSQFLNNVV